jgi:hypothetical protein
MLRLSVWLEDSGWADTGIRPYIARAEYGAGFKFMRVSTGELE